MKKFVCFVLAFLSLTAFSITASAGVAEVWDTARIFVWRYSNSSGSEYVAYVDRGKQVTLDTITVTNSRYKISGTGYNSANKTTTFSGRWGDVRYLKRL